jgi:molybdate transport system regulatory protein
MIDEMNRMAPYPLVLKQRGGANGGGTSVSDYGERMLREYLIIQAEINKVVAQINVEINL